MIVHFEEYDEKKEERSARISIGEKYVVLSVGDIAHLEQSESCDISFDQAKRLLEEALEYINKRISENGEEERL